jgi:hypothetical protein
MRAVLAALGIDPRWVAVWSLYGVPYDGQQGTNPAWDFPIPEPGAATDPSITIVLHAIPVDGQARSPVPAASASPGQVASPPIAVQPAAPAPASSAVFSQMEADWNAILQIELQLAAAAKQLNATLLRLNSLNRDLSSEEARCGDQLDKRDWQDARRWLRDGAARLSRFLKDHHMGMTSTAGKRESYATIYRQYVVPRRSYDSLAQAEREFEFHRKSLQMLLNNMNAAHSAAVQDGERRAQQVLTRIAAKVRAARAKR